MQFCYNFSMKHYIAILFAAGLAVGGHAESFKLPAPDMDSGLSVMQSLKVRHSERAFAETELTESELSGLLWAANGFNRPDKRTNATGMNKQTIVLYVCMKSGAYRYDAKANELVKVCDEDLRPAVAGRQEFAATAPVSVVIAADTSDPLYKGDRVTLSCYDAGIVSGNIYLYCAAQNLATVCRATMDREKLKKGLGLGDNITLHLNHPVGHFVGESAAPASAAKPATPPAAYARVDHVHPIDVSQGPNKKSMNAANGLLEAAGCLTNTWNIGDNSYSGAQVLLVSRLVKDSKYERKVYLRTAEIGRAGNIVSVGAELGFLRCVVNNE